MLENRGHSVKKITMTKDNFFEFDDEKSIHGHRILVIDTDANIRRLISRRLNRSGAQVYPAANSGEGLEQYLLHRPDLVIIDVTLPESDGWEACRKIREISLVPVLMLIGSQPDQATARGFEYGANEFVRKPFDPKLLLARTNALLQRVGIASRNYRFI